MSDNKSVNFQFFHFVLILADYTKKQMHRNITEKLNEVYDEIDSSLDKRDIALQFYSLDREDW